MLSNLTLAAPLRRPVLIELYAVGVHILATLPCSVNPHVALAGKSNYLELLPCFGKESQMEDQGPLIPIFHIPNTSDESPQGQHHCRAKAFTW